MPLPTSRDLFSAQHELTQLGRAQDQVVSQRQLVRMGVPRWRIRAQLQARRWRRISRQAVVLHSGEPSAAQQRWCAVFNVGPHAALAGVTALQAVGFRGFEDEPAHVIVPKSSRPRQTNGVRVHESRRYRAEDLAGGGGPPRMTPARSAIDAALWARSDRAAALILVSTVQQGLTTPDLLFAQAQLVRRHRRRKVLYAVLADLGRGAQALSELDFLAVCRRFNLPEPSAMNRRTQAGGRTRYLDAEWDEYAVCVEIDGAGHLDAATYWDDMSRANELVVDGRRMIRFPAAALHTEPERVADQLGRALRTGGWPGP